MTRASYDAAPVLVDTPVIEGRYVDFDGCTVSFETYGKNADATPKFGGKTGHPAAGRVPRLRFDATTTGFVLELEEEWDQGDDSWYCREMFRADVSGGAISQLSVYCTGDWDRATVAHHAATVPLLRR